MIVSRDDHHGDHQQAGQHRLSHIGTRRHHVRDRQAVGRVRQQVYAMPRMVAEAALEHARRRDDEHELGAHHAEETGRAGARVGNEADHHDSPPKGATTLATMWVTRKASAPMPSARWVRSTVSRGMFSRTTPIAVATPHTTAATMHT